MYASEKNGLEQLTEFNRWRVVLYWRWLWWQQSFENVPLGLRLFAVEATTTGIFLAVVVAAVRYAAP